MFTQRGAEEVVIKRLDSRVFMRLPESLHGLVVIDTGPWPATRVSRR